MVFASIIQGFSWDQMSSTHWIVPASWYLSILFSLFSVILGAQQTVLIDMRRKSHDNLLGPRQKLCPTASFGGKDERQPQWALVLAWQGPLMFLSYSLVMFLVGLTAYVITPVARKGVWDNDAKVCSTGGCSWDAWTNRLQILLMYSVGATVILGSFMAFSRMVHYTLA